MLTAHGLSDASNPVMVVANADQAGDVAAAMAAVSGIDEPTDPVVADGVAFITAPIQGDATSSAAFRTVDRVRDAVHAVDGADALVSGGTAILDDIEQASARDNRVVIPAVLVVVMLILVILLRALVSPVTPRPHGGAVVRRRLGVCRLCCSTTSSASPAPTRRCRCSSSCSWWPWASTTTSS